MSIKVNMAKANEIAKAAIRKERIPLLQELDAQYMRALETKNQDEADFIVAQKQALRDATAHSDLAKARTPNDLKAAIRKAIDSHKAIRKRGGP